MSKRTTLGQEIIKRSTSLDQIANHIDQLHNESLKLDRDLKQKEAQIKELKEGIPIEKADKKKRYQILDDLGRTFDVEWWATMGNWIINTTDLPICKKGPFYHHPFSSLESPFPLPPQISETQEGE